MQQLQPLRPQLHVQRDHAGQVAARPVEAGDEAGLHDIDARAEDDGNRRGRRLGRRCRGPAARRNHAHAATNQIRRQSRQSVVLAVGPAVFDRHVDALDISRLLEPLMVGAQDVLAESVGRVAAEPPDHRHCRLRARGERPKKRWCCCRAAEKRDELAAVHSITSSARCRVGKGAGQNLALATRTEQRRAHASTSDAARIADSPVNAWARRAMHDLLRGVAVPCAPLPTLRRLIRSPRRRGRAAAAAR